MTGEGTTITITTPTQADLERMAEDGHDIVRSDPSLMSDISEVLAGGVVAHLQAYRAQPEIEVEGEIL
jgi:ribulose-5-phosphate 4-epimerase/fuculose-1-phosphate aldolase